jgi:G:T-mismatch repair DNA endonuclease (very short patch repair protein)
VRRKGIPRSAVRKHNRKRFKSSIEKLVAAWLEADGIPFRTEVKAGRCHIDIVIGKLGAVELNGCYWHACHKCYPLKTREQQMKRHRDLHRMLFLGHKRGYKFLVLWECEILNTPDEARQRLRDYANVVL